jgi:hypothetical protein
MIIILTIDYTKHLFIVHGASDTSPEPILTNKSSRQLYGLNIPNPYINCPNVKNPVSNDVRCVKCQGLDYCSSLNNYFVQEVYYPDISDLSETCSVIESLGSRMNNELFGRGRSFRDTKLCRGDYLFNLSLH